MNEQNKTLHAAMDDLHHIRSVLEKTEPPLSALAPTFRKIGLIWLIAAILLFLVNGSDRLSYLWPDLAFQPFGSLSMIVYLGSQLILFVFLLVQCVQWQDEKKQLVGMPRKVLTLWQLMLAVFLAAALLTEVAVEHYAYQVVSDGESALFLAAWSLQWFLPAIFPAVPLLVTSIFWEDRPLRWMGAAFSAVALLYVILWLFSQSGSPSDLLSSSYSTAYIAGTTVVSLLKDFLSPAALLLLAWRLKKEGA